jgi:hypothetical protein
MATNINAALAEFMLNFVNLDRDETNVARASLAWLLTQLSNFPIADNTFPTPYHERDILLGSFHRRTKTRPLDDIDLISVLSAEGSNYTLGGPPISLHVAAGSSRLLSLCHDDTILLNSKRVLNKFVTALKGVGQYRRADIGRNGEAAVIDLTTYPWSFDVVPAFFTKPESDGRTYYLIPDGEGHWKKTDPRIDEQRIAAVKQKHGATVLPCIRLLKYWNKRRTVPTVKSYTLESMILSHYENQTEKASELIDVEFARVLNTLTSAIHFAVPDPKNIQGDLNTLTHQERIDLSAKARSDVGLIVQALDAERLHGDHRTAIARWREVIGDNFPSYG